MTAAHPYANEFIQPTTEQIAQWNAVDVPSRDLPVLIGLCPSCHHECEIEISNVLVKGVARPQGGRESSRVRELTRQVICSCHLDHDQPEGVPGGCGRYWLGRLTLGDDGKYQLSVEENVRLLFAAMALNQMQASQDARVQAAAEKWLAGVTAIFGLFSLAGVATAKDALRGLSTDAKWLIAAAVILSLGLAACALGSGYVAAYGWLRAAQAPTTGEMQQWYDTEYRGYARKAASRLSTAVLLAFAALGALAAVMLLVWFLPRAAV